MRTVFLAALLLAGGARYAAAQADVYIGVGAGGVESRPKLALAPFRAADPRRSADSDLAGRARDVLRADLLFSRYFEVATEGPAVSGLTDDQVVEGWRGMGRNLVLGEAADAGKPVLVLKLYDLQKGEVLADRRFEAADWRHAVHAFSDEIVQKLTGRRGIARTRIAFVNNHLGTKEVFVADYDGANFRRLTQDRSICLLPKWTADGREVFYTTYKFGNPDLMAVSAVGGPAREVLTRNGLNLAGGFSPDGQYLLVTLSNHSATDIFRVGLTNGNREPVQITHHAGIDASPTYSPDGRQIAFVSDRSGNPNIFIQELETGRTRRLTNLNWTDSPAWSPNGDWIALSGRVHHKAKLNIYLVDLTGSQLRQLTRDNADNEDPSWSPDGRYVAFTTTRNRRREIYVMDADGSAPHRLIEVPGNSFTSSWSP